jgi:hypothetical protein
MNQASQPLDRGTAHCGLSFAARTHRAAHGNNVRSQRQELHNLWLSQRAGKR